MDKVVYTPLDRQTGVPIVSAVLRSEKATG